MASAPAKPVVYEPRPSAASEQDSLPGRYRPAVQWLAMGAFTVAFFGWLNESWLFLFDNPIWLNRYTEYAIIAGFGVWRILAERNPYTRKRLLILVAMVTVFWWLIPWLLPMAEPYVGYLWGQPVFPSVHVPGTVTFFLILALVFLFGRRVICGFNCPCVGIRETVGFAFRDRTVRSKWIWKGRHVKWVFFLYYVGVMVVTQYPPSAWTVSFVGGFYLVVGLTYFGSFFIVPFTGNRFYCRYLCPYGATFGLLNHAGFYDLKLDADKCNDCRRCEQVCDMGIPVWEQGKAHGRVTGIEDCMGCARCVVSCPTDALEIRDVRNLFRPNLVQNASHLLKQKLAPTVPRRELPARPAAERVGDWNEGDAAPSLEYVVEQASRCLDCGVPGCRNACPLHNRIPEWLQAAARGDVEHAAQIAHSTSPMPEVCGRLCPQHRLCEGACTLAPGPGAVAIGAVERGITELALERGWRPSPVATGRRSVGVIGAGPAGLACAERLAGAGVAVTVYDREPDIGGLLTHGVPSFKLDPAVVKRRRALWEASGITFAGNTEVDAQRFRALMQTHDGVFIGTGAQRPREVSLPGDDLEGVVAGLDFLRSDAQSLAGQRVLVLGGGDTAMDCARSALRRGAEVMIAYRGPEMRLRASPKEVRAAREEGAGLLFEHEPAGIEGKDRVRAVRFRTPEGPRTLPADLVVTAFGFVADGWQWARAFGLAVDETGRIRVDAHGRTSRPGVYAGGDNTRGPDLVVTAMAAGRVAAETMLKDLQGWRRATAWLRSRGPSAPAAVGSAPAPAMPRELP